jgi:hypothetical protein
MVVRMADEHVDPSGSTEAFQAFVRRTDNEPKTEPKGSRWVLIGAVAAVIIVVVVLVIALR